MTLPSSIMNLGPAIAVGEFDANVGVFLDTTVGITNPDSTGFSGGSLVVEIAGAQSEDSLSVGDFGQITVFGNEVRYSGVAIGTVSGGSNGSPLTISLTGTVTSVQMSALASAIKFTNTSATPPSGARAVSFTVTDHDGDVSASSIDLTINPTLASPISNLNSSVTVSEIDAKTGVLLDTTVSVTNPDGTGFSGGSLVVSIASPTGSETLAVAEAGSITVVGNEVRYNGVAIGTISGGTGGAPLTVALSGTVGSAQMSALASAIKLSDSSDNPSGVARDVIYSVTDHDGDISTSVVAVTISPSINPVINGLSASVSVGELTANTGVFLDTSVGVSNADGTGFSGGLFRVYLDSPSASTSLSVGNLGAITVVGNEVRYNDVAIGTITGGSANDLQIVLSGTVGATQISALASAIVYSNSSNAPSPTPTTVHYEVTDRDGDTTSTSLQLTVVPTAPSPITNLTSVLSVGEFDANAGAIIDTTVSVTNPDATGFSGGSLVVSLASSTVLDTLSVGNVGLITVVGSDVLYGGVSIGTVSGGTSGSPLTITLSGTVGGTQMSALASAIKLTNSSTSPPEGSRSVTYTITDTDGDVSSASVGVTIVPTAAGAVTGLAPSLTIGELSAKAGVFLDTTVTASNPDGTGFSGGSIVVSLEDSSSFDSLSVGNLGLITVVGNDVRYNGNSIGTISGGSNGSDLTISLSGTVGSAQLSALASAIRFTSTDGNPSPSPRTVTYTITDHDGDSSSAQINLAVIPTVAPVVGSLQAALVVGETDAKAGVLLDATVSVSNADGTGFSGGELTVTIAGATVDDALSVADVGHITRVGDDIRYDGVSIGTASGGVGTVPFTITLSGAVSSTQISALASAIKLTSSSNNPSGAPRNVTLQVSDNDGDVGSATIAVTINPSLAPTITGLGPSLTVGELNANAGVFLDASVSLSNADGGGFAGGSLTVEIAGATAFDTLSVGNFGFISVVGNEVRYNGNAIGTVSGGTNGTPLTISLSGTVGTTQMSALASAIKLVNSSTNPSSAPRTVTYSVVDHEGDTASANLTLVINPTLAPTISNLGPTVAVGELSANAGISLDTTVFVSNPDGTGFAGGSLTVAITGATSDDTLTVASSGLLTVAGNQVSYNGQVIGTISGGVGTTPLSISLTGPTSTGAISALSSAIRLTNSSSNPSSAPRTVTYTVVDNEGDSTSSTLQLVINPTLAPTLTNLAPSLTIGELVAKSGVQVDTSVTVTNPDGGGFGGGALVVTIDGATATDTLTIGAVGPITLVGADVRHNGVTIGTLSGGNGTTPLTITFTGTVSGAQASAVASAVRFVSSSNNPDPTPRAVTYAITDHEGDTTSGVVSLVVNPSAAPVISGLSSTLTTNELAANAGVQLDTTISVSNPDAGGFGGGSLVVSIAGATASDTLSIGALGPITLVGNEVRYNGAAIGTASGGVGTTPLTVSLAGTVNSTQMSALASAVKLTNSSSDPSATPRTVTLTVTDAEADVTSATIDVAITPSAAPIITGLDATRSASETLFQSGVVLDSDVTLSNPDDTGFGNGTMVVSLADSTSADSLSVTAAGQITVVGNEVRYAGVTIATVSGGNSGTPLNISFATNASAAHVTALAQSIVLTNSSQTPPAGARDVTLSITDNDGDSSTSSISVTITPVNDPPFNEGDGEAAVVQGDAVAITSADLFFSDPDTSAGQIVYTFTAPAHGQLLVDGVASNTFTQAEVDSGLVTYQHDGVSGSDEELTFSVSDGTTTLSGQTLLVDVTPLNLDRTMNIVQSEGGKFNGPFGGTTTGFADDALIESSIVSSTPTSLSLQSDDVAGLTAVVTGTGFTYGGPGGTPDGGTIASITIYRDGNPIAVMSSTDVGGLNIPMSTYWAGVEAAQGGDLGAFWSLFDVFDITYDASSASDGVRFAAGAGNDHVTGTDFDDQLNGGSGDDTLVGGEGNDWLNGLDGNDVLDGGGGENGVYYGDEQGAGGVTLNFSDGTATDTYGNTDTLIGIRNAFGSNNDDVFNAGGAGGDHWWVGLDGADQFNGGDGWEKVSYVNESGTSGIAADLATGTIVDTYGATDTVSNINGVQGSQHADVMFGDDQDNNLEGMAGDDAIDGRGGRDRVEYYWETDSGGVGGVTVELDNGSGTGGHTGGTATDSFGGTDTLTDIEDATGTRFTDTLLGSNVDNNLDGAEGNDTLDGRDGNDWLDGGADDDTIAGGGGDDRFVFRVGDGNDTITDFSAGHDTEDRIVFDGRGEVFYTFGDILGMAEQVGDDTVIDFGNGDTLTLQNVNVEDLVADDFEGLVDGIDVTAFAGLPDFNVAEAIEGVRDGGTATTTTDTTFTLTFDDGGTVYELTVYGSGFTYAGDTLTGGTIDRGVLTQDGEVMYRVVNFGLGASEFYEFIDYVVDGTAPGFFETNRISFHGSDQDDGFSGGALDDYIEGNGGSDVLQGNDGNDELKGGDGSDQLYGGEGHDNLRGDEGGAFNQGDDMLFGGGGDDSFKGGAGADYIDGGTGEDRVRYDLETTFTGDDATHGVIVNLGSSTLENVSVDGIPLATLAAGTAIDTRNYVDTLVDIEHVVGTGYEDHIVGSDVRNELEGEGGDDTLYGNGGDDELKGGDGSDTIHGGDGNDNLRGDEGGEENQGDDQLFGGDGYDSFKGGAGNDHIDGGADRDRVDYDLETTFTGDSATHGVIVNLSDNALTGVSVDGIATTDVAAHTAIDTRNYTDTLVSIESVVGTGYQDIIVGNDDENEIEARGGNDTIDAGGGNDWIDAGEGDDTITGGAGDDRFKYRTWDGADTITDFQAGDDTEDRIVIDAGDWFVTFDGIMNMSYQDGADTVIDFGDGNILRLEGVDRADLTDQDFEGLVDGLEFRAYAGAPDHDLPALVQSVLADGTVTLTDDDRHEISYTDGDDTYVVYAVGDDLEYDVDGLLTGGTIRGFGLKQNGEPLFRAVNANLSAAEMADLLADLVNGTTTSAVFQNERLSFQGSDANDVFGGGAQDDHLDGHNGNDLLFGNGGNDMLRGGDGTDTIYGGAGNDVLRGDEGGEDNQGDDQLFGEDGEDEFKGGAGNDHFDGGADRDGVFYNLETIFTGDTATHGIIANLSDDVLLDVTVAGIPTTNVAAHSGIDTRGYTDTYTSIEKIQGTGYQDLIIGNADSNELDGLGGNDELRGGDGGDTIVGGAGNDVLDGGDGYDYLTYQYETEWGGGTQGVVVDLAAGTATDSFGDTDTISNFEAVQGTHFEDQITGDDNANLINGHEGDDILNGAGGNDRFVGGQGNDTIDGGDGNRDRLEYHREEGGQGINADLVAGQVVDTYGDTDTVSNIERVIGSRFDDVIVGNDAENQFDGLAGNDHIDGGDGADFIAYGREAEEGGVGGVEVYLHVGTAFDSFGNTDTLVNIENVAGSDFDDVIVGDNGANELEGLDGDDRIVGYGGDDYLTGDGGADTFVFGSASGNATINDFDFEAGDRIDVALLGYSSIDDLPSISFDGQDTLIQIDGDYFVRVKDVNLLDLPNPNDAFVLAAPAAAIVQSADGNYIDYIDDAFVDATVVSADDDEIVFQSTVNPDLTGVVEGTDFTYDSGNPTGGTVSRFEVRLNGGTIISVNGNGSGGLRVPLVDFAAVIIAAQGGDYGPYSALLGQFVIEYNATTTAVGVAFASGGQDDHLYGGDGADTLDGGGGNDRLEGNGGEDELNGGDGSDDLIGGEGADTLVGGDASDHEADFFVGGAGNDTLIGGENEHEFNRVSYNSEEGPHGVIVNLSGNTLAPIDLGFGEHEVESGKAIDSFGDTDTLINVQNADLTGYDDHYVGDGRDNDVRPLGGTDFIDGRDGFDSIRYDDDTSPNGVEVFASNTQGSGTVTDNHGNTDTYQNIERVLGSAYNDVFHGGDANEEWVGGGGDDQFFGGAGDEDTVNFDAEKFLDGNPQQQGVVVDLANGTATDSAGGTDTLDSIERIRGTDFADVIHGDGANNTFEGRSGSDQMFGGDGRDRFVGGRGNDVIDGGASDMDDYRRDVIDYGWEEDSTNDFTPTHGVVVNLSNEDLYGVSIDGLGPVDVFAHRAIDVYGDTDEVYDIEEVQGTNRDDLIVGGDGGRLQLNGRGGNDVLIGGDGEDNLQGGSGDDTLRGGTEGDHNSDFFVGGRGNDTIIGGEHDDEYNRVQYNGETDWDDEDPGAQGVVVNLSGESIDTTVYGFGAGVLGAGQAIDSYGDSDTLIRVQNVTGTQYADLIVGGDENNDFNGGKGADTLDGGDGNDQVNYRDDQEQSGSLGFTPTHGVIVNLSDDDLTGVEIDGLGGPADVDAHTALDIYGDTDILLNIERIVGTQLGDHLVASNAGNRLSGEDGDDVLIGGEGEDDLAGGRGNDIVNAGGGNFDYIAGSSGTDQVDGGAGFDLLAFKGNDGADGINVVLNGSGAGAGTITGTFEGEAVDTSFENLEKVTGTSGNDTFETGVDFIPTPDAEWIYWDRRPQQGTAFGFVGGDGADTFTDNSGVPNGVAVVDYAEEAYSHEDFDGNHLWGTEAGEAGVIVNLSASEQMGVESNQALDTFGATDTIVGVTAFRLTDADDFFFAGDNADGYEADGRHGDDMMVGGAGKDLLVGDEGEDTIIGGGGDDSLAGGADDDLITGGEGADTFSFRSGHGTDTITDFDAAEGDIIDVEYFGFDDISDFASVAYVGGNTVIDIDGTTTIVLENYNLLALGSPNDAFHF